MFGAASQHNRDLGPTSNRGKEEGIVLTDEIIRDSRLANRRLAKGHYENFVITSCFLPRRFHQAFFDIYAFCRTADDLADESASPDDALRGLDSMEQDLEIAIQSNTHAKPERLLFFALADTIQRFRLSDQPFRDLLEAFRQDQFKVQYETESELLQYCERSANPVGRILLDMVGEVSEKSLELSDSICTGLQLVNFLQDIEEDYHRGRIYLPANERDRFSVNLESRHDNQGQAALRELVRFRCNDAKSYLEKGLGLTSHVPSWFSRTVRLFVAGGLETIRAIENQDYNVMSGRPKVSKAKQLWLLCRAAFNC